MSLLICLALVVSSTVCVTSQDISQQCLDCICEASTGCDWSKQCFNAGGDSYFCGPFQISWAYWSDAGRPGDAGGPHDFETCLKNKQCAEQAVIGYMRRWRTDCNQDGVIDCLDFAAIHKTGPHQCNSHALWNSEYWHRFAKTKCYAGGETVSYAQPVVAPPRSPPTANRIPYGGSISHVNPHYVSYEGSNVREISDNARVIGVSAAGGLAGLGTSTRPLPPNTRPINWTLFSGNFNLNRHFGVGPQAPPVNTNLVTPRPHFTYENTFNFNANFGNQPGLNLPRPPPIERPVVPTVGTTNVSPQPVQPPQPQRPPQQPPANAPANTMVINENEPVSDNCLTCICHASSRCNTSLQCDGSFCGPYLLSWAYWADGGKPGVDYVSCALSKSCAEKAIQGYMAKWSTDCNRDGVIDCDDFAAIHKTGPGSCGSAQPDNSYWREYNACSGPTSSYNAPSHGDSSSGTVENVYFRPNVANAPPRASLAPTPPSRMPTISVKPPVLSTPAATFSRSPETPYNNRPNNVRELSIDPTSSGREPPPREPSSNPAPVVEIPIDETGFGSGPELAPEENLPLHRDITNSEIDPSYARERAPRRYSSVESALRSLRHTASSSNNNNNVIPKSSSVSKECMDCICEASSGCDPYALCTSDIATAKQCGAYQISFDYWRNAGQPGYQGSGGDFETCAKDKECAEEAVRAYVGKVAKDCNGDGVIDCLDFAALHSVGQQSCSSQTLVNSTYWKNFQQCYGFVR